jgi:hypothetical protein
MARSQERYRKQANKYRREVDWKVGDKVYIKTKTWRIDSPSKKLAHVMAGPYEVLEQVGHSYRIKFPASIRVHPIIPPDRLRKAANDPLPGQYLDPEEPIHAVDGVEEWEVEGIIASRLHYGKLQYRIDWKGHDLDPDWYYAEDVRYCPQKVKEFHMANPTLPGPPKRLDDWLKLWEQGEDTYSFDDDNFPAIPRLARQEDNQGPGLRRSSRKKRS